MPVLLSHGEITILMRALLRSLKDTPESEQRDHEAIYGKISEWFFRTLPRERVEGLAKAIARATGK